jgi:hypothetical protein
MIDQPAPPPLEPAPLVAEAEVPAAPAMQHSVDGSLVIDLTQLNPPPRSECVADEPDPFNPEIVVCKATGPSPRLGPVVGPVDEEFGSAIPRARIKLSDKAEAQANATNPSVGGWNAQGGEVRLKIDF